MMEFHKKMKIKYLNKFLYFCIRKKGAIKGITKIPKAKVKCAVNKINCVLYRIQIEDLTELNNTNYGATAYVFELVGANKIPKNKRSLG